jgi:hypothetical protein
VQACSADISVIIWQWKKKINPVVGHSAIAHSWRNFDKIKQWALERSLHDSVGMNLYIPHGLETPITFLEV